MPHLHTLGILSGTDSHERDSVTMLRIHVCLNLKNEAAKVLLFSTYDPRLRFSVLRLGSPVYKILKHFFYTKISQSRTKINRGQVTL